MGQQPRNRESPRLAGHAHLLAQEAKGRLEAAQPAAWGGVGFFRCHLLFPGLAAILGGWKGLASEMAAEGIKLA
jgi:hypothetical protein